MNLKKSGQEISHGYGDDELDVEAHDDEGASDLISLTTGAGLDVSVVMSKKTCKCRFTKHLSTSHSECPLRKDKQVSDKSNAEIRSCKCGSIEHLRTSHHNCPFNNFR